MFTAVPKNADLAPRECSASVTAYRQEVYSTACCSAPYAAWSAGGKHAGRISKNYRLFPKICNPTDAQTLLTEPAAAAFFYSLHITYPSQYYFLFSVCNKHYQHPSSTEKSAMPPILRIGRKYRVAAVAFLHRTSVVYTTKPRTPSFWCFCGETGPHRNRTRLFSLQENIATEVRRSQDVRKCSKTDQFECPLDHPWLSLLIPLSNLDHPTIKTSQLLVWTD